MSLIVTKHMAVCVNKLHRIHLSFDTDSFKSYCPAAVEPGNLPKSFEVLSRIQELHVTVYWQHPGPGAVTSHPLTFRLFVHKGVWLVIASTETLSLTNYWKSASWMSWTSELKCSPAAVQV